MATGGLDPARLMVWMLVAAEPDCERLHSSPAADRPCSRWDFVIFFQNGDGALS
jgi:hypothetical protein